MVQANTLYRHVLSVTTDYLGPAAQRFVDRQIDSHINKPPDKLTKKDLEKLVEWSKVSMALLTNDQQLVDGYVRSLLKLTGDEA